MAANSEPAQDEKPLDPAAERVRQKMVRFLAINLGILFFAVMIVLGAVVYRAFLAKPATEVAAVTVGGQVQASGELLLPSGAEIVSQSLSGNNLSLLLRQNGAESVVIYDLGSGKQLGRHDIRRAVP